MPTYTSPDNIFKLAVGDTASDVAESQAQGDSVQIALAKRGQYSYYWNTASDRTGTTGMRQGDTGFQADTSFYYTYWGGNWKRSGSVSWNSYTPTVAMTSGTYSGSATGLWRPRDAQTIEIRAYLNINATTTGSDLNFSIPSGLTQGGGLAEEWLSGKLYTNSGGGQRAVIAGLAGPNIYPNAATGSTPVINRLSAADFTGGANLTIYGTLLVSGL